nr:MAG: GTP cyclohydrolase I FolE2 [Desulfobulbus propionicus]
MIHSSVGIHNLSRPVSIRTKTGEVQHTIASIDLQALLPHDQRESCLDIMIPVLADFAEDIHIGIFQDLLGTVQRTLQAQEARLIMTFPYFICKKAPVSATSSLMEYTCTLTGSSQDTLSPLVGVRVPVTTLCPCSREISTQGAHNQRARVILTAKPNRFIWLESLIDMVESSGSSPVYALLKRPDEKFVTENAYANPMFVEDVARKVALQARSMSSLDWFSVSVESFESIHNHNAYAYIDSNDLEKHD